MAEKTIFMPADALLAHWQGHRRLTRRVIEAFPEDKLFSFSVGGMRPFGELAMEMLTMAVPMAKGVATGEWATTRDRGPKPKQELLRMWDENTDQLNRLWGADPARAIS
ncbi:MAG TPA: hypothetical protein VFW44_19670 [Bryobacteraceae bacterium]|nr:hypothetical protein [Bryobacteraceae bacterium]